MSSLSNNLEEYLSKQKFDIINDLNNYLTYESRSDLLLSITDMQKDIIIGYVQQPKNLRGTNVNIAGIDMTRVESNFDDSARDREPPIYFLLQYVFSPQSLQHQMYFRVGVSRDAVLSNMYFPALSSPYCMPPSFTYRYALTEHLFDMHNIELMKLIISYELPSRAKSLDLKVNSLCDKGFELDVSDAKGITNIMLYPPTSKNISHITFSRFSEPNWNMTYILTDRSYARDRKVELKALADMIIKAYDNYYSPLDTVLQLIQDIKKEYSTTHIINKVEFDI